MNKEQYVTYETSKLLKKKGFYWDCDHYYKPNGEIVRTLHTEGSRHINSSVLYEHQCLAPTQQMACDWVEKTCGFFIEISRSIDINGNYHYFYMILDKTCKYASSATRDNDYSSKSDAIEAALQYCLTKLI